MKIDKKSNQLINCTEDDDYDVEFSIGAVIIWLLPPKNPSSRPIYFEINQRGFFDRFHIAQRQYKFCPC